MQLRDKIEQLEGKMLQFTDKTGECDCFRL